LKKKILTVLLCITAVFSLTGCRKDSDVASTDTSISEITQNKLDDIFDYSSISPTDYIELSVEYNDTSKVDIRKYLTITEADIDDYITENLETYSIYEKSSRKTVEKKDIVNIDVFIMSDKDGTEINSFTNSYLTVGSGDMDDAIEEKLINHQIGETIKEKKIFNEDYDGYYTDENGDDHTLAGVSVTYSITINYICSDKVTIDSFTNNDVVTLTNGEYTNIKDYRDYINKTLVQTNFNNAEIAIWKMLVSSCNVKNDKQDEFNVIVAAEYKNHMKYYEEMASYYSMKLSDLYAYYGYETEEAFNESVEQEAENVVKQNFIIYYIANNEKLLLSEDEYNTSLQNLVSDYGYTSTDDLISDYGANNIHAYSQMQLIEKYIYSIYGIEELAEKVK
jgi:FKBP-type peptidyl-prolyl cis-trans isomerase (trigger factor)